MSLSRDLIEILGAFAARNVRYLIVGGHAVSLHARPRSTKDLDLWLEPTRENVLRACNKKAVGRPTDRRDVIALERAAKGTLPKRWPARRGSK